MIAYDNFDSIIGSPIFFTEEVLVDDNYSKNTLLMFSSSQGTVTTQMSIAPDYIIFNYLPNHVVQPGIHSIDIRNSLEYGFQVHFDNEECSYEMAGQDLTLYKLYNNERENIINFHSNQGNFDQIISQVNINGTFDLSEGEGGIYTKAIYDNNLDFSSLVILCDESNDSNRNIEAFTFGKFNYNMLNLDNSFSELDFQEFKRLAKKSNLYFFQGKMNELE